MSQQKSVRPRMFPVYLSLALALVFSSMAWAGKMKEYSAEQFLIQKGKEQHTGTLYVSKDKMRMEQTMPGQPEQMFIIIRQDKKLTWTVFPEKKKYMESSLTEEDMKHPWGLGGPGNMKVKTKEERLGLETINGYKCEKKRIETTMEMMGREMTGRSTVWISDQLDFPIRTEAEGDAITELRNIKSGRQDKGLFELPSGYTKAASMMEMMSGGRRGGGSRGVAQPGGSDQMPEELRKMLEQEMGNHGK